MVFSHNNAAAFRQDARYQSLVQGLSSLKGKPQITRANVGTWNFIGKLRNPFLFVLLSAILALNSQFYTN
jgi:hypothetical protein